MSMQLMFLTRKLGNWKKSFKEGSFVCVRIHGYRHLEGLATGIVKTWKV
ncbi:hypothetical protein CASFOL_001147 [Castilleja foliolosa]|uniref:Rrp5 OB-fold domain-containing protein n=1 Tax=Castilleja foliolosa TaxID=1961234 RepID=A0ABD3EQ18_9LAMI